MTTKPRKSHAKGTHFLFTSPAPLSSLNPPLPGVLFEDRRSTEARLRGEDQVGHLRVLGETVPDGDRLLHHGGGHVGLHTPPDALEVLIDFLRGMLRTSAE